MCSVNNVCALYEHGNCKLDGKFALVLPGDHQGALKAITTLTKLSLSHKGSKLVYNDWLGYIDISK